MTPTVGLLPCISSTIVSTMRTLDWTSNNIYFAALVWPSLSTVLAINTLVGLYCININNKDTDLNFLFPQMKKNRTWLDSIYIRSVLVTLTISTHISSLDLLRRRAAFLPCPLIDVIFITLSSTYVSISFC